MAIERRNGPAAMVDASELTSLLETAHLLRSPRNAQRLLAALERARGGTVEPQSVESLREELGLALSSPRQRSTGRRRNRRRP